MANGSDPRLGVRVETTADVGGVKTTTDAVKELDGELARIKESNAKAAKSHKEHAGEVDNLTKQKKGLIAQIKVLKHEIPELGLAINLIRNPYVLLGGAISLAVGWTRRFIESVDEASRAMVAGDLPGQFDRFQVAAQNAKERAKDFAEKLNDISAESDTATLKLKGAADAMNEVARLRSQLNTAQGGAEKAAIDLKVARGEMTPAQGAAAKAVIDKRLASAAAMAPAEGTMRDLEALHAQRDANAKRTLEARGQLPEAAAATKAAEIEKQKADARAANAQAAFNAKAGKLFEQIEKLQQDEPALRARLAALGPEDVMPNEMGVSSADVIREKLAKLDALREEYAGLSRTKAQAEADAAARGGAFQRASGRQQALQGIVISGAKRDEEIEIEQQSKRGIVSKQLFYGSEIGGEQGRAIGFGVSKELAEMYNKKAEEFISSLEKLGNASTDAIDRAKEEVLRQIKRLDDQGKNGGMSGR